MVFRRIGAHNGDAAGEGSLGELPARGGHAVRRSLVRVDAAAQRFVAGRHGDFQIGAEAVHRILVHRKPARRIHQIRKVGVNRGELDSEDRGLLVTGQLTVVGERQRARLALGDHLRQGQPHAHVFLKPRGWNLASLFVGDLVQAQGVVQLERNRGCVVDGEDVHRDAGGEGLRHGIDADFARVILNVDPLAVLRLAEARREEANAAAARASLKIGRSETCPTVSFHCKPSQSNPPRSPWDRDCS